MRIYAKKVDHGLMKTLYAAYYTHKCMADVLVNVVSGDVKIGNKEVYQDMMDKYIKSGIEHDKLVNEVTESVLGSKLAIVSGFCNTVITPQRGRYCIIPKDNMGDKDAKELDRILRDRGFEVVDTADQE